MTKKLPHKKDRPAPFTFEGRTYSAIVLNGVHQRNIKNEKLYALPGGRKGTFAQITGDCIGVFI